MAIVDNFLRRVPFLPTAGQNRAQRKQQRKNQKKGRSESPKKKDVDFCTRERWEDFRSEKRAYRKYEIDYKSWVENRFGTNVRAVALLKKPYKNKYIFCPIDNEQGILNGKICTRYNQKPKEDDTIARSCYDGENFSFLRKLLQKENCKVANLRRIKKHSLYESNHWQDLANIFLPQEQRKYTQQNSDLLARRLIAILEAILREKEGKAPAMPIEICTDRDGIGLNFLVPVDCNQQMGAQSVGEISEWRDLSTAEKLEGLETKLKNKDMQLVLFGVRLFSNTEIDKLIREKWFSFL